MYRIKKNLIGFAAKHGICKLQLIKSENFVIVVNIYYFYTKYKIFLYATNKIY